MKRSDVETSRMQRNGPVRVVYFESAENRREFLGLAVRHARRNGWRVLDADGDNLGTVPFLRHAIRRVMRACEACPTCDRPRNTREAAHCIGCARDLVSADAPGS